MRFLRLLPVLLLTTVSTASACNSGDGLPEVSAPTSPKLELAASEMRYDPSSMAVESGDVPVVLRNTGNVIHDLRIEDKPTFLLEAPPGQTATATWALDDGRYRLYCSLPGHRQAGMEGILEVR